MKKSAVPLAVLLHLAAITRPFTAPAVPAPSIEELTSSVQSAEYHFRATGSSVREVSAPNRMQGLRTHVSSSGGRFVSRTGSPSWSVQLRLDAFGRSSALVPVRQGIVTTTNDRAEIGRPLLSEWYVNAATGIEHGLDIPHRPLDHMGEPLVI